MMQRCASDVPLNVWDAVWDHLDLVDRYRLAIVSSPIRNHLRCRLPCVYKTFFHLWLIPGQSLEHFKSICIPFCHINNFDKAAWTVDLDLDKLKPRLLNSIRLLDSILQQRHSYSKAAFVSDTILRVSLPSITEWPQISNNDQEIVLSNQGGQDITMHTGIGFYNRGYEDVYLWVTKEYMLPYKLQLLDLRYYES